MKIRLSVKITQIIIQLDINNTIYTKYLYSLFFLNLHE